MGEAVKNHNPEIVVIDEISTSREASASKIIAEKGVALVSAPPPKGSALEPPCCTAATAAAPALQRVALGRQLPCRRRRPPSYQHRLPWLLARYTTHCAPAVAPSAPQVGTAHGISLSQMIMNPELNPLVGGVHQVIIGDAAARLEHNK
jgi:stage III sporulation protein SpoIIIAA